MAERRMIARSLVDSDAFLDMPSSTQNLYFHLNIRADDDGFIDAPKKIMRSVGAKDDDLKILLSKRYILDFDSGVVVIKHWRMHNLIRADRHKNTHYLEEKELLNVKENGSYTERQPSDNQVTTNGMRSVGKTSVEEVREDKNNIMTDFENFYNHFGNKQQRPRALSAYKKARKNKTFPDQKALFALIDKWKLTDKWKDGYQPYPSSWLNGEGWLDELPKIVFNSETLKTVEEQTAFRWFKRDNNKEPTSEEFYNYYNSEEIQRKLTR